MVYRIFLGLVIMLAASGTALAADCSDANQGLQELNSLANDLSARVQTLRTGHQQLKDVELCQIGTRLKQAIVHIRDGITQGCLSPEDASDLKGKLEGVEAAADSVINQACVAH